MERMLERLERRIGGYAIPHLPAIIVAGMAAAFVLGMVQKSALPLLALDVDAVKHGEIWRLVTFLFLPQTMSPIFIFFSLAFTWFIGSTLEQHWGAFRFNLFYLLGCTGTAVAAYVSGDPQTNEWLNFGLILAFGTLFPDEQLYIYILPVKAKWMATMVGAYFGYACATEGMGTRAAIVAVLIAYFLLCGSALFALLRGRRLAVRQAARRVEVEPVEPAVSGTRTCAICGAAEVDGADIRVCSCAKCGGTPRHLCLAHARQH